MFSFLNCCSASCRDKQNQMDGKEDDKIVDKKEQIQVEKPDLDHLKSALSEKNDDGKQNELPSLNLEKQDPLEIYPRDESDPDNINANYIFGDVIGVGCFATVRKAIHKQTKRNVAIKKLRIYPGQRQDQEDTLREVKIMKLLRHENLICFIDMFTTKANIYIVMELMECTLTDYINKYGMLDEPDAARVIKMIANGVSHIHEQGFVHFDLKQTNILVNFDNKKRIISAKITDFGLAKENNRQFLAGQDTCGTLISMAPEMLQHNHAFDHRVDIWCLGIMLYRMLSGEIPYKSECDEDLIQEIVLKNVEYFNGKWQVISTEAKNFVENLLKKDP